MKTLPFCLGMVRGSEQQLAKGFGAMALKHGSDFEIHQSCKLFQQWCEKHLKNLEPFATRHGTAINPDPARVKRALFHGPRIGGFGLLRDLQDLLLLTHQARTGWTALVQAAKEMKETDLAEAALECAGETDRQIDSLCTHIKITAPQALTVPVDLVAESADSAPFLAFKVLLGVAVIGGIGIAVKGFWLSRPRE
jgi:ferredoxin-nitrate reductase